MIHKKLATQKMHVDANVQHIRCIQTKVLLVNLTRGFSELHSNEIIKHLNVGPSLSPTLGVCKIGRAGGVACHLFMI